MRRVVLPLTLGVALVALPAAARAQHGELQLGLAASHGSAAALRAGAGPVAGIALGRLVYVGARWLHHRGSGTPATRAQLLTADVGVVIPVAGVELVPGASIGAARIAQRGGDWSRATELVVAPGAALHVYVAGLVLIPELQYAMTGRPDGAPGFGNRGRLASLRVALPMEVGRIRQ